MLSTIIPLYHYFLNFKNFIFIIYFLLAIPGPCHCPRPSPVTESRAALQLWCAGFSLWWPVPLRARGSRVCRHQQLWAQQLRFWGSKSQAQELWRSGPAAPGHAESSRNRNKTFVSCAGRCPPPPLSHQGSPRSPL